jgi:glucose uptake protein
LVTPTTWLSALLLLLVSLVCLGSWPSAFKKAGSRWRFELFSFDFAVGALLLALLAAYTFGTFGSELGFSDRMLVAGRTNEAIGIVSGGVFALGNMLLLSAVSLIGMAAAFPLAMGLALAIAAVFEFQPNNVFFLLPGIVLLLMAAITASVAAAGRPAPPAAPAVPTAPSRTYVKELARKKMSAATKGIIVGFIGGGALGVFFPIVTRSISGDFGLGAYAGTLMISLGLLPSTVVLNFYFMNIAIHGGPLGFDAYFKGKPRQHFLGFAGGAICALGILAAALGISAPVTGAAVGLMVPSGAVLLAMLWGFIKWKEFASAPKSAKISLFLSGSFFVAGVVLVGVGHAR